MFGNIVFKDDLDKLTAENASVLNTLGAKLEKHLELVSHNISEEFNKLDKRYSRSRDEEAEEYRSRFLSKFTEREVQIATLGKEVVELLSVHMEDMITAKKKVYKASGNSWHVGCTPRYKGIDIFGHIDRVGEGHRSNIKAEMAEVTYSNEVLGKQVMDIDRLVYVSFFTGNLDTVTTDRNRYGSFIGNFSGFDYVVELNALLIRYMSTLSEYDLEALIETICMVVTDKVCRLVSTKKLSYKFAAAYVPNIFAECSRYISPRDYFITMVINKVLCDGANGLPNMDDENTMEKIVNLADMSLKNAGSIYNISKAARTIQGMLQRKSGRPKYLERFLDLIAEHVENKKGDIVSDMNTYGKKFSLAISPEVLNTHMTKGTAYVGTEDFIAGDIDIFRAEKIAFEDIENNEICLFSVPGMESVNSKLEDYKKKTRAELMAKLSSKERRTYMNLENEVIKYKSDAINCKDASKKNVLLTRSKSIGKIIALELSRKDVSEYMALLLSMLEDTKYTVDGELSSRDFNRERNTRMYGQFVPSGDFDY